MAKFILLLAILSAAASFVLFTVGNMAIDSPNWATDVCSAARLFCHNPQQLAYAAAGLAGLWLLVKIVSAVRD